ncbi:MAG: hypothetical protein PHS88_10485 [Candidatus Omnitrophica bacterium]|nr:hypothetical protein [Candidatus Omnitrophota bacterium]
MKKEKQTGISRREFIKRNLLFLAALCTSTITGALAPLFGKSKLPAKGQISNVSQVRGRYYKTWAG